MRSSVHRACVSGLLLIEASIIAQSGGKVSDPQPARKQLPEIEKHATCFSRHPLQIQQEELRNARKACIAMH